MADEMIQAPTLISHIILSMFRAEHKMRQSLIRIKEESNKIANVISRDRGIVAIISPSVDNMSNIGQCIKPQ